MSAPDDLIIDMFGKRGHGLTTVVDWADRELVSSYRWTVHIAKGSLTKYARARIDGRLVYLHRLVSGAVTGEEIDHIDGDGLNNRHENLRRVTHAENIAASHVRRNQRIAKAAFDAYEHVL